MAKTNKQEKEDGKPVYVSFNKQESAALRKLGWRERWLYHELKWLANFKTGQAGNFRKQRITYEQLASLVRVPSSQGRAGDQIDDKEAARLMMRLNAAGLIGEIDRRYNDGLLFCLPLSPIDKKAAKQARDEAIKAEPKQEKLPDQTPARLPAETVSLVAANDDAARASGTSSESRSVLMSPNGDNHTFFNTDGPGQPAPAPADLGGGNPAACGGFPTAAAGGAAPNPVPENPTQAPTPAMTAADIEEVMETWGFLYARTGDSRKFYKRWQQIGIDHERLMESVREVSENWDMEQTPAAVDRVIRGALRPPVRRYAGVAL